jgi:hypothetical protein
MKTTLTLDGVEVAPGSTEVVDAYAAALAEAVAKLHEARQLMVHTPDVVATHWRKAHDATVTSLRAHLAQVSRFAEDYSKRGLESAVTDARWRRDLPRKELS